VTALSSGISPTSANAVLGHDCVVGRGAYVGAGVRLGDNCKLDFGLVAGVPARRLGWVGRAGVPLLPIGADRWRCPQTGEEYVERSGALCPAVAA